MFCNFRQLSVLRRFRRQTTGVALVITLSILAIVALLAIAFVLTARTELKSGSAFNNQAAAKALAKMAVDRALMEIVRQGAGYVISGGEVTTNNIILNYFISANDFTKIDNYTNDTVNFNQLAYGSPPGWDFVERDGQLGRSSTEPYWMSVRNTQGSLIGRFAYVAMGNVVDLNAIGNIAGAGDTYRRPADALLGYGYLGQTNASPTYTRGICADVSLQKFLTKLGYGGAGSVNSAAGSAQRILQFRYGCPANLLPAAPGAWLPGSFPPGSDSNNDGEPNNPSEYTVTPSLLGSNQAIGSLSQLDGLPATAQQPIAPDPGNTNLANYAACGPSADPNLVNPYLGPRMNLNELTNGTPTILTNSLMVLTNILANFPQFTASFPNYSQFTNSRVLQVAVNLLDFHTANRYPTVWTNIPTLNVTNLIIGVKATPYLNQVVISNMVTLTSKLISNNATTQKAITGLYVTVSSTIAGEIWQPYPTPFPDVCQIIVTNIKLSSFGANATAPASNLSVTNKYTNTFSGPIAAGIQASAFSALYTTNCTWISNQLPSVTINPVTLTQIVDNIRFSGIPSLGTTNLINQIINAPFTNVQTFAWGALPAPPAPGAYSSSNSVVYYVVTNLEADDPRMNLLYLQTNSLNANCNLGAMNVTCFPNGPNTVTNYPDTGNREGIASFYVQTNGYLTIGDIGYVYRGEPWATIRLQPYIFTNPVTSAVLSPLTYGDGKLMDYFRINDLIDVAGRINVNSDTNGPTGANQSPALFALFSGITNSAYLSPGNVIDGNDDGKITAIINDIGNYRAGLANGSMVYIGQMCAIPSLTADLSGNQIPYTNDAGREALIRAISNLITTWQSGGTTTVIGWGQVIKGGDSSGTNGVPGMVVAIQATFKNVGGRIKLTSFQYLPQ